MRWLLRTGLALALLGSLPLVSVKLGWYGAWTLLGGLAGGFQSFRRSSGQDGGRIPLEILAPAATFLILYGMALAAYNLAAWYQGASSSFPGGCLWGALIVSLVTGWFVNLSYVSIHRY